MTLHLGAWGVVVRCSQLGSACDPTACALLCDTWGDVLLPVPCCVMPGVWCHGVLVGGDWGTVSWSLLCGPTACAMVVRCSPPGNACGPTVCDDWCVVSSYPGVHCFLLGVWWSDAPN